MRRYFLFVIVGAVLILLQGCASSGGGLAGSSHGARMKVVSDGVCQDVATGLMWQVGYSGEITTWGEAKGVAMGVDLGGYTDWRLPSSDELYTLHDLIEAKLTGDCVITDKDLSFWTGESKRRGQVGYWHTYPLCGGVDYEYKKQKSGVVRAVRQ